MVSRVLVPMDDSEMAERALEFAIDSYPDTDITVLHVAGKPSPMMGEAVTIALDEDVETAAERYAEDVFDRAAGVASEHDVEIDTEVALGSPAKEIVDRAAAFDLVVVGSHSGSLTDRLVVGNVAKKVFNHSPVPVTVVR